MLRPSHGATALMAAVLVVAARSAAAAPCPPYTPGATLSWEAYVNGYDTIFGGPREGVDLQKVYTDWVGTLDRELSPALYEVFTDPAATLTYGSYSDAVRRYEVDAQGKPVLDEHGDPSANSFDQGQGLRVLWQLGKGGRLISAITFWRFDASSGQPELVPGFDSLRVRSQLVDFVARPDDPDPINHVQDAGTGFVGLSYSTQAASGATVALYPTPPLAFGPDPQDPALKQSMTGVMLPVACAGCHRGHVDRGAATASNAAYQKAQREAFLAYASQQGASPDKIVALRAAMTTPEGMRRLFLPAGLLDVLARKCQSTPEEP